MVQKYTFLHIGKTGGTALRDAFHAHNATKGETRIGSLSHKYSLRKIVEENQAELLIFFVREPVSRFVSGFNSRLRKGRFGDHDWHFGERIAFRIFSTPNALGEALGSWNPAIRLLARLATSRIIHLKKSLADYVGPIALLEQERHRIFYIGSQETLDEDFGILKRILKMDPSIALPTSNQDAHRAPDTMDRRLSEKAIANIRRHYHDDFAVRDWCLAFRSELIAGYAGATEADSLKTNI
jgi:hypothetical protein